jgi:GNAT superfamily N-acetyltransferase
MIRFATSADQEQLKKLWQLCFNDSESFIDRFLMTIGRVERCLVWEEDKKVVSMLFILPAETFIHGELRSLSYIYACATLPDFRGKGLMKQMLEYAFQIAQQDRVFALFLIPANPTLSSYYKNLGFKDGFLKPVFEASSTKFAKAIPLLPKLVTKIIDIRNRYLAAELNIRWTEDYMEFVLKDLDLDGGSVFLGDDSYTLFADDGSVVESIPLNKLTYDNSDFGLVRFCEPYNLSPETVPYINCGLN